MILANVLERIGPSDVALVIDLLARGDATRRRALERTVTERGVDPLLDDPELPNRLKELSGCGAPSAPLFIYVAVRHALLAAGIDDVRLSDYLGALVLAFGLRDRAHRISDYDDATYRYLTDIVADLASSAGRRGFLLCAHLGNYSLWLSGIFPDFIAARRERRGGPDFGYYEELGARGYRLASDHRLAHAFDLADVYQRAATAFPRLRIALNRLSDRLLFPYVSSPDRILRQVADEVRLND